MGRKVHTRLLHQHTLSNGRFLYRFRRFTYRSSHIGLHHFVRPLVPQFPALSLFCQDGPARRTKVLPSRHIPNCHCEVGAASGRPVGQATMHNLDVHGFWKGGEGETNGPHVQPSVCTKREPFHRPWVDEAWPSLLLRVHHAGPWGGGLQRNCQI